MELHDVGQCSRDGTPSSVTALAITSRLTIMQAGLCLTRTAYLLGLFGPDASPRIKLDKSE